MKQKTEYEKDCQQLFEQIRHLVSSTHQVPEHLDKYHLLDIIHILTHVEDEE